MIRSPLLSSLGIVHGYSTRTQSRECFFDELGISKDDVVQGEQVHGIRIAVVTDGDKGKILSGTDGLVSKRSPIAVAFADCVPVLAVDKDAGIIGTAHAGWKGTLGGIAGELIAEMKKNGANVGNVYISIGPHIGMCCYNIKEDRAGEFQKKFGMNEKISIKYQGEWRLDIGYANYVQLLDAGVMKDHIDAPVICTSCRVAEFHSFRKDSKEKFGVQLGVISI